VKLVMQKTSPSGVTLGPMIVVKGGACEGKSVLLARQKSTQVSKAFHALYPDNIQQGH
jgi:archaellum biogenesis ATPase FlaH